MLNPCPRCAARGGAGQLLRERYDSSCEDCKGHARVCDNCLVTFEWSCIQCGFSVSGNTMPRWRVTHRSATIPPRLTAYIP